MPHHKPHLGHPKNRHPSSSSPPPFTMNQFRKPAGGDRKTVAYAVNYEPSLVDRFFGSSTSLVGNGGESPVGFYAVPVPSTIESYDCRIPSSLVPSNFLQYPSPILPAFVCLSEVEAGLDHPTSNSVDHNNSSVTENATRQPGSVIVEDDDPVTIMNHNQDNSSSSRTTKRRSTREPKQRVVNMIPCKVRYDMESVPFVDRLKMSFWQDVKVWPPRTLKDPTPPIVTTSSSNIKYNNNTENNERIRGPPQHQGRLPNTSPQPPTPVPPSNPIPSSNSSLPNSVIWKPLDRKEWEDSVGEMTAVCTSAALRQYTGPTAHFTPPLSKEYIRDRIDIDDPLQGYQIRHASGGWLQGFCLWTNFTTWTHHFVWDSLHPASGMEECTYDKDADGSLAKELQGLPRCGSPTDGGIVFEQIAEIALLGGLGCGELMLRMAMEDILKRSDQKYKFIVLQATKGSRPFYERFGFKRVGAICRYATDSTTATIETPAMNNENALTCSSHNNSNNTNTTSKDMPLSEVEESNLPPRPATLTATCPSEAVPIQGYRHWTHHNESQHSLDLHGGPSYMMCLKLPEEPVEGLNLLEQLQNIFVAEKPIIQSIGGGAGGGTPTTMSKKKLKRTSSMSHLASPTPYAPSLLSAASSPGRHNSMTTMEEMVSNNKRRKVSMDRLELGESASLAHRGLLMGGVGRKTTTKSSSSRSSSKPMREQEPNSEPSMMIPPPPRPEAIPTTGVQSIDRTQLVKQKVKSYPRDSVHFFNKVVQPVGNKNGPYYFCLHYNKAAQIITICPMEPKGTLSGKRAGRPRYQCVLNTTSENWITAPTHLYEAVPAFMVMKTPLIGQEAWDINTMT